MKLLRKFLAWLKGKKQDAQTIPATPTTLPTDGTLIDPPNYPAEWVRSRAEAEEVGMQQDCGVVVRCRVWYPSCRNWFILSTPFKKHVRNIKGGKEADTPFEDGGAVWVLRGWRAHSPSNNSDPNPAIEETGNASKLDVAMWEVRAQ